MLNTIDYIVIGAYVIGVFLVAALLSRGKGIEGFLVNRRSTRLPLLVFSIVSTTIGAGFFMSVAAEAYETGISFALSIGMVSFVTALVLAWLAPRIKRIADKGEIVTVPELMANRYGSKALGALAGSVIAVGYLFVTALQFVGIGGVASVVGGFDFSTVLLIAGVTTIAYTAIGGIQSDFYADAISFVVMGVGILLLVGLVLFSSPSPLSTLPSTHWDPFAFAGPEFLVMSIVLSAMSAFIFMELWQRIFAAQSIGVARKAFLISAVAQPLFVGGAALVGLAAVSVTTEIGKEEAVFEVIAHYLPSGLTGLAVIAVIAVLMTTVNSLVVVGGSTLYVDVFGRGRSKPNGALGLRQVRLLTAVFGALGLALAYFVPDLVRLLLMGAFVLMPLCPAIAWGLFARERRPGVAILSVTLGLVVTLALMPVMPETAFGPGFLVSGLTIVVGHVFGGRSRPREEGV